MLLLQQNSTENFLIKPSASFTHPITVAEALASKPFVIKIVVHGDAPVMFGIDLPLAFEAKRITTKMPAAETSG
ncbi:MAG: hypothetical protein Tsb002_24400 [Wenzhouxiangellaceae bacterium]